MEILRITDSNAIFEAMLTMRTTDMYSHEFLSELADFFLAGEQKAIMKLEFSECLAVHEWYRLVCKYTQSILAISALTKEAIKRNVVDKYAKIICNQCAQELRNRVLAHELSSADYQMLYNACCT